MSIEGASLFVSIILILIMVSWFVFSLLGAVEKIVRGVHEGKTKEEIDYTKEGVQAVIALILLFFLLAAN